MATSTPWGPSQQTSRYDKGVTLYSTAGHGGFKLSPTKNALVPEPLRQAKGWYEEDCEAYIVFWTFTSLFDGIHGGIKINHSEAEAGVKMWFPDEFEEITGQKVTAEESPYIVGKREFLAAHAEDWISHAAVNHEGKVKVWASKGGVRSTGRTKFESDERMFLVDSDAYAARSQHGYIVQPNDQEI